MSKASLRNWFFTVLVITTSANLTICPTVKAETEYVSPEGYIESYPYAKWFLASRNSSANELVFRMYGNEGMARNLFVLSCRRQEERPITVEFIPPKALEERLRTTAPATPKRTAVKIFNAESRGASEGGPIFESAGEYDKIAVFVDLSTERQLFHFLQLLANNKRSLIRWEQAKIEYLLENNEFATDRFISNFRESLLQARHEELSYQDVYTRCSKLQEIRNAKRFG